MKILIDSGHPAHIHFFYPIIKKLEQNEHHFVLCIREKDCSVQIAHSYNLRFISKGKGSYSLLLKPFYLIHAIRKIYKIAKINKPDIFLSFASPYAGIVAWLLKKPHIVFDDTDPDPILQGIYRNFSSQIITPSCFSKNFGAKHIKINAYKELSYLNPEHFKPNPEIKKMLNIPDNEDYILVRLVNHGAMHDIFAKKWCAKRKFEFIQYLSLLYNVIISSEDEIPHKLEKLNYNLPESKLHQVIANAKLVVGESATVATESAVLGIPSLFIDYNSRGYIDEIGKEYSLIKHFKPTKNDLKKSKDFINTIMSSPVNPKYQQSKKKLLFEKIDLTAFLVWFIENYPESVKTIKENPNYQYNFQKPVFTFHT